MDKTGSGNLRVLPAPIPAAPESFHRYPRAVLAALRRIRDTHRDEEQKLAAGDRSELARALNLMSRHIDMQAQIDAASD